MKNLYKIGDTLKPIDGSECRSYNDQQNAVAIRITNIDSDSDYHYDILNKEGEELGSCNCCFKDENLTPVAKTLNTLQVGDYVQNEDGHYKRLLAVLNRSDKDSFCVYVMSTYGKKDSEDMSIAGGMWTVFDLKESGWMVEDPTPETENTKAQIAGEKLVLLEELTATIRKSEFVGVEVSAILSMIQDMKKQV